MWNTATPAVNTRQSTVNVSVSCCGYSNPGTGGCNGGMGRWGPGARDTICALSPAATAIVAPNAETVRRAEHIQAFKMPSPPTSRNARDTATCEELRLRTARLHQCWHCTRGDDDTARARTCPSPVLCLQIVPV